MTIINKNLDGKGAEYAKWSGAGKIVFDMCDNHFGTEFRDNHLRMCGLADLVTCSTEEMRRVIKRETFADAAHIPDPYEFEFVEPAMAKYFDCVDMILLWHGNNSSVPPLLKMAEIRPGVVRGINKININECDYDLIAIGADNYDWSSPYSHDGMLMGLCDCDAVIIPTEDDWWYRCKSPNRMVNPIVRGRFVIANEMPAYEPFKEWMYIGDIAEGLAWLKQQSSEEICKRIGEAQKYITRNHSPTVIGEQWEKALLSLI